jgi:predicted dehydrogenase
VEEAGTPEGVVVATPTATHAAVLDAVLPLGVPVYVEKPLAPSAADASRLAEAAPDRLFVMDKWRYHPGIELLRDIARSGELGPPLGVKSVRVGWGSPHRDVDSLWILAPHDLSIALEILGHIPAPRAAVAERVHGTAVALTAVLGGEPWATVEVSSRERVTRRETRLVCRDGAAVLADGYAEEVRIERAEDLHAMTPPEPELRPISSELPLLRELRAFVEHLGGGPPPKSSAAEGAAIVEALAALRRMAGLDGGEVA